MNVRPDDLPVHKLCERPNFRSMLYSTAEVIQKLADHSAFTADRHNKSSYRRRRVYRRHCESF